MINFCEPNTAYVTTLGYCAKDFDNSFDRDILVQSRRFEDVEFLLAIEDAETGFDAAHETFKCAVGSASH